jgi:large subunit ribosomal protein L17
MLRNMVTNLIREGQMRTTLAKAKEVRRHADRVITMAKTPGPASYVRAMAFITDKSLVRKLFFELAPRFANRSGGYTRILRAGPRPSDNSQMAIIEYLQPNFVSVSKRTRKNPIVPPKWVQNVGTVSTPSSTTATTPEVILPSEPKA